jgi:hypothetical protein
MRAVRRAAPLGNNLALPMNSAIEPYFLETFIDPERFRGTCYRAANWVVLGRTTGRGKDDRTHRPNRSIKEVLALPLHRRFHELLRRRLSK